MKLDSSYADDQKEGDDRNHVEWGYSIFNIKILAITNPCNLHHREDIYNAVLACILMHNMMVEAWLNKMGQFITQLMLSLTKNLCMMMIMEVRRMKMPWVKTILEV
jgi:hypothetical protein